MLSIIRKKMKSFSSNHYWIIAFLLGALAMYVMLSYSQLLTTGKYIVLAGDTREQYIAQIRMILRSLIKGENPLYSFSMSMGLNTIVPLAWHVLSPFNILYLLFWNADVNVVTAAVLILKTGTAAATFQFFASRTLKENSFSSILFSIFYAMCAFSTAYGMYQMIWLDGLYILPIVALGVYRLVYEKKTFTLIIAYSYIFIVQFYMGYMIGIFSFLLFVLLLFFSKSEKKDILRISAKYVLSFVNSVAISAIIWIPFGIFLLNHKSTDSSSFESIGINFFEVINNLFWGQFQGISYAPYVYCGIPCIILLISFLLNKKILAKTRILGIILLLFFCLSCIVDPLNMLMHAFDAPDGYFYRFSYIISFIICVISCKQFQYAGQFSRIKYLIIITILLFFYALEQNLEGIKIGQWSTNTNLGLLINAGLMGLWILSIVLYEKNKKTVSYFMIFLALAEVISNGVVRCSASLSTDGFIKEAEFYAWDSDMKKSLEEISKLSTDDSFYRMVYYDDSITHNGDSYWGYYGVTDFETAENQDLREFLKKMGLYTSAASTYPTGMTPTLESLLSIKYSVRLFAELNAAGYEIPPRIKENPNVLPIGFMVENAASDSIDFSGNVFENQNLVFSKLSGIDGIYKPIPDENREYECLGMMVTDDSIFQTDNQPGQIIFRAKDLKGDAFLQIDSAQLMSGLYYMDGVSNVAHKDDNLVCIPFSAKMWGVEGNRYIMIYSDESFPGAMACTGINMYELDEKNYQSVLESLKKEPFQIESIKNGIVKGRVKVNEERRILFTSIPYIDGWKVLVNGEKMNSMSLLNGTFLGVELPEKGDYFIEFKYECPGFRLGMIISIIGALILIIQIAINICCNRFRNIKHVI